MRVPVQLILGAILTAVFIAAAALSFACCSTLACASAPRS